MRSLEVLLGRYPDAEMALADDLAVVPPPIPPGIPAEILERRPDLVGAEHQIAAAFYNIQVAQADPASEPLSDRLQRHGQQRSS